MLLFKIILLFSALFELSANSVSDDECKTVISMPGGYSGRQYWVYETATVQFGKKDNYNILSKLGEGSYATAYLATRKGDFSKHFVIKVAKTDQKLKKAKSTLGQRMREALITQYLCGNTHIVKLLDIIPVDIDANENIIPGFVFEYVNDTSYRKLYPQLTPEDVKRYAYQFLRGIAFAHSKGVIHKDIKLANMVIDNSIKQLKIIDWGLARFYFPNEKQIVAGSPKHKAPEVLMSFRFFDYSIDMWSFGTVFAQWIFRLKRPFFHSGTGNDPLYEIARVLGLSELKQFVKKYPMKLNHTIFNNVPSLPQIPWSSFVNTKNADFATPDAIDLLDSMLKYDFRQRISAQGALKHAYFTRASSAYR